MTTAERIRKRRKDIGMSADRLADEIGVSRSTIFRYENGFIEKIPVNNLAPIARALNTTIGYLMGWDDNPEMVVPTFNEEGGYDSQAKNLFDSLPEDMKAEAVRYLQFLSERKDN